MINKKYTQIQDSLGVQHSSQLNRPWFITGFSDGECSFLVSVTQNKKLKTGWVVKPFFSIKLHQKDHTLLTRIPDYFFPSDRGCSIYKDGKELIKFRVSSLRDLNVIIDHFEKFPLITQKRADYELFKRIVEIVNRKEHITEDGLKKILAIKASLNNGLSDELKAAFPNIIPVQRPIVKDQSIPDPD